MFSLLNNIALTQENKSLESREWEALIDEGNKLWEMGKKDSVFSIFLELETKENELSEVGRWRLYKFIATKLQNIKELEAALDYRKRAYNIHPDRFEKCFTNKSIAGRGFGGGNNKLALQFSYVNQYDSSIYYTKIAAKQFLNGTSRKDSALYLLMLNNIGYYFYKKGELDSSSYYYQKVISDFNKEHFPIPYGLAIGNLGQLAYDRNDFQTALDFSLQEVELNKNREGIAYINVLVLVAKAYYKLDRLEESNATLKIIFRSINENIPLKKVIDMHRLKAEIAKKQGNYKIAFDEFSNALKLKDSLQRSMAENSDLFSFFGNYRLSFIKQKLVLSQKEASLAKANEAKRTAEIKLYLSLSVLGFIITIIGLYAYQLNHKKKEKLKQLEKELLELELTNKKNDLTQMGLHLSSKREFFNEIKGLLEEICTRPNSESHKNIQSLIRELNHRAVFDENQTALWTNIDKVNNSFFETLGNKFPKLTRTEKEICALLLLNFSTKEIANIRNVTPNAIKKKRQIIRKKLPITAKDNLVEFLLKCSKS